MSIFWVVSFAVLVGLVAGVIALAVYRRVISHDELDIMHVRDAEVALIAGQQAYADRLDAIDTWGKRLTIAAVSYAVVLAVSFVYAVWRETSTY